MAKCILAALVLACWIACTSFALFYLAPVMFFSARPEMVLIAFLVPALWMICSVLAFIAWADAGWPPEPRSAVQIPKSRTRLHYKELNA
ncbi:MULTISPECIES: hypothetical protein [Pseudomonas]|uniref:hypothetical protein n=1 Tax=Pseudomonas TaxID=286 RepID=UPI001F3DC0FF|nr:MULTISPECIES: hypothetical protein [Pseudomonas]MDU9416193.1 hypothetical protein [Pseudomonas sp. zfem005]